MEATESAAQGCAAPTAMPRSFSSLSSAAAAAAEEAGSAIRSIAGVYVEASSKSMDLFQAVQGHLLPPDLALTLLEAQAATGGIVDLAGQQQVSVVEALARGLVGLEMKERLLQAERAATGFTDPYTEGKISLYQAIQKEIIGRQQGLHLLEVQLATGGVIEPTTGSRLPLPEACERGYLDEELSNHLSDPENEEAKGFLDPNSDQKVTYMELLRRCVADPATGLLLLPLKISFPGLRGAVCSHELLDAGIIDSATFKALHCGEVSAQDVAETDRVEQYLSGISGVAGVAVLQSNECKSLYQALAEHLLMPGTALSLLQAQAATGCLVDPVRNERLTVDAAVRAGLVGPELYEKLSAAERAVTGYKDPYTGDTLSLFQAMKKGLVPSEPGLFLLDAQLATGGVVDPHTHHRLPVEVAFQRDLLDKATHALLCNPTDDTRGFFEPNTRENLSYSELLQRCVTDPDTGLCLLPLSGSPRGQKHSFIDHDMQLALRNREVPVTCGRFKGRLVSLWRLLFSDYFTGEQRRAFVQQLHSGQLSMQRLADHVCHTLQRVTAEASVTFEGLRDKVTPAQLLSSQIIDKDTYEKLAQGETLAKDLVCMGAVKKYLEGTGSISGLLLMDSQEKVSVYQARKRGLLRPGVALILLEAQAATGHIVDPVANQKYSVDEALRANVIGPDVYEKLLTAEKAVTGFRDPYTGHKISLFQAMGKELIVKEHAIRLLEAQIATGGIIDPVNSHRLPVEAAYKRGYFDRKMNVILSDPSDDTKGFFDPNTQENLTYLQLKERCITESTTGLCLLPLYDKKRQLIDAPTKQALRNSWLLVKYGRFRGQRVSVWDLLNSEYFSEGKRREILSHYCLQRVTLPQIRAMLEQEMKKWAPIRFPALRGNVSAHALMEIGLMERTLFERLLDGAVSPEEVLRMEPVRRYLYGTGSIGGIVLQPSNERVSLYEAMKRNVVLPGVALPLLEAQAATGFIIDPVNNQKFCLDVAVREGLVGPELYEKLQRAEKTVTGYRDPFTGQKISLFQAMKKGLVADKLGMQLMDAQLATGGVIDPHRGHYVPIEFAQKKGYLDEDLSTRLSNPSPEAKTFHDLDGRERVSYSQLLARCQRDPASGTHLLPVPEEASQACTDEEIRQLFRETFVEEKGVSLWELLHSDYFTEEQRRHYLEQGRAEAVGPQQLVAIVLGHMKEAEMKAQSQVSFQGLRGPVPAVWLLDTGIISGQTFQELVQGQTTVGEVSGREEVRRYLQGTGSIAGIFVQASHEKMGVYQAMQNSLLLPGMAAQLLEAQAATGTITDPVTGQRLGVEEAIQANLVGEELATQLLQAERALTGYTDPYSGKPISVCQAIRKELIPASVGIPLLEAQLAAGGIIDPIHCHHLPLPAAYKHGFYDEEMHRTLAEHTPDTRVFFDPNTQESVTYQQLKDRCLPDAHTGLLLFPLSEDAAFYGDSQAMKVLKSVPVCVNVGRFKGQEVSLWNLLNSEYVTSCTRRELMAAYKEKTSKTLQVITTTITKLIEKTEQQGRRFSFRGLRKQVSANDLFQSQLIDKATLDELSQGKKTVQDVTEMDSVRRYLEGCNFIAGVLLQPDQDKMSIYQAMRRGLLRPGAALVLLEAQAATGFLIDPVKNLKLSVDEAMSAGLIGREIYEKLLSAERAVTGYTHPYTKDRISLFEAMRQDLIVRSHGVRLLEAQIATGGIIDPVHSHRIPVQVAYKRGYFDEAMNQVLLDPTDDTKGFFDPNTHENLTYLQLLERCIQDPETGLYMLQIVRRGEQYFYIDEATKQFLQEQPIQMHVGRYRGQRVSVWDLLCSVYIQEHRRKELVRQYKYGALTLEQLCQAITTIVEDTERSAQQLRLQGLRGEVSVAELFNSEIIDKRTLDDLHRGLWTLQQLAQKDAVKRYLEGTGCIAGISVEGSGETLTFYEATKRGLLSPENALLFLEAQAATGFITDPLKKSRLSVDQAVSAGLVGDELHEKLLFAEKASTGYADPSTGNKISLFQAMRNGVVEKAFALRLLEAQIATGGIIDPVQGHRLPADVASRRGCLDDDTFLLLTDAECGAKGFVDPNTHQRTTYAQLLHSCLTDRETGMHLLPLLGKQDYICEDKVTRSIFLSTKVKVERGIYQGQTLSLWALLTSDYVGKEQRKQLVAQYRQESSAVLEHIAHRILSLIKEKEGQRRESWFQGLRQQITASELLSAEIISTETMKGLEEGKLSVGEVATMDSVRRYLEGTSCIAGVLVPSKSDPSQTERMTVYQAMWKGVLRPGTALVLLEAQAATGFIIDPLKNAKLSVDEAIHSGLVGGEIYDKLLSAEKAVTGYTDPYTGQKISLFQAMKKDLIVKEHGVRLLEAQVATGGIIDPLNSHRVPVDVAYRRGYFDEELNQVLLDPTDDTKGFFDPNTHENLTYMELLRRCRPDPETGLWMLQIQPRSQSQVHLDENLLKTLKSIKTTVNSGFFQGQELSLWELLFSTYISQKKRQDLLSDYKSGKLHLQEIITIITSLIEDTEKMSRTHERRTQEKVRRTGQETASADLADPTGEAGSDSTDPGKEEDPGHAEQEEMEEALKSRQVEVAVGTFRGQKVSVWDLLHSAYFPKEKQKELLQLYYSGILTLDQMVTVVTGIVTKTEEEKSKEASHAPQHPDRWEDALRSHTVVLHVGEFQGQEVPLWDLLFSQYIPDFQREELLTRYRSGALSLQDLIATAASFLPGAGGTQGREAEGVGRPVREESGAAPSLRDDELERALRQVTIAVPVGELQGSRRSVWELLFSKYVTAETRQELLEKYRARSVSAEDLVRTITGLITEMEEKSHRLKFSGLRRQVTASELFDSRIIDQDTLSELTQGSKTVEEVTERDTVKRYLEGTSCIAGVLVPSKSDPSRTEKMSIYQAMWKGVLRPGTALVLLEAQAATGFIVDPLKNVKLSVDEAVSAELVGAEIQEKLVSAERAVTGYKDPYTGDKISLFQAMKNGLIVHDHGVRLLEAQIATGGIIDPVESHRLPVEVAYQRGYFDQEMNQILSDPTDDTKGFFDPNTHENLTYMQLLHRCTPDPDTGLLMLHVMDKGSSSFHLNENTRKSLQAEKTKVDVGLFQGQEVSLWDLLFSRYVSPHLRQDLLRQYKAGTVTIQSLTRVLTDLVTETEERNAAQTGPRADPSTPTSVQHQAARAEQERTLRSTTVSMPVGAQQGQQVPVWDLLFSNYVSAEKRTELLDLHQKGLLPLDQLKSVLSTLVTKKDATSRPLAVKVRWPGQETASAEPLGGAAALLADPTGEAGSDSTHPGKEEDPGHAEQEEMEEALKSRQVEVAVGTFRGQKVSVWDLLHSAYFPKEKQKELLQLYYSGILTLDQMVTVVTGIVTKTEEEKSKEASHAPQHPDRWEDALRSHTVVLHVGEFQGQEVPLWDLLFSQYIPDFQREELLTRYRSGALSLQDLIATAASFLPGAGGTQGREGAGGPVRAEEGAAPSLRDDELERALRQVTIAVPVGELQGSRRSVWELLFSKYVTAETRQELLEKYRARSVSAEDLVRTITGLITEMEEKSHRLKFSGLRRQVTASELFDSRIIDQDTLSELTQGSKTVEEVTERDTVKRYLEGTSCIAGVLVPSKSDPSRTEKMSIYQAMWKGVLRPGTALVLLEAQAATGFIVDPLKNVKLSVDEAVSAELVGAEIQEKLVSAERAVTGYKDPYTGDKISLFQAMKNGLIVHDHGVRLLEAQIATGGIIDPVESHRLPVEVAYQRGYFDQEMNQILSDPTDDTKGFFDPNTHENLTYMQLLHRCTPDPDTGLLMLHVMDKGSSSFHLNENTRKSLQAEKTKVDVGLFQGQEVSLWDLLFSRYVSPHLRQDLLRQYKAGTVTIQSLTRVLTDLVTETEERNAAQTGPKADPSTPTSVQHQAAHADQERTLRSTTVSMPVGAQQGQQVPVWDLLFSNYVSAEKRTELLDLHQKGLLPLDQLKSVLSTLVTKKDATSRPLAVKVRWPGQETASAEQLGGAAALLADPTGEAGSDSTHPGKEEDPGHAEQEEMEEALKSRKVEVAVGTFRGQKVSVWDLLHSAYFPKEKQKELLQLYYSGILTLDQMVTVVTGIVTKTEEEKSKEAAHAPQHPDRWEDALRSHTVVLHVGEFQGQEVPLWDLLFSQYIPDFQREELLTRYRSGALSLQDLIATAASFLPGAGGTQGREAEGAGGPVRAEEGAAPSLRDDELERALRQVTIAVPVGELQGSRRSVWELLFSKYVTAETRQELLEKYRARSVSAEDLVRTITGLITEMEEKSHRLKFSGLRRQVTASELFDSRIIDQDTLSELTQGSKTVEEVTERDTVKRYLEGTSCIAGVLVPSKSDPSRTEKMSIYQAMWKGVLRPGTALVLLEAQAATGFIVDPLKNVKLSVDEAVSAELVGAEIQEKLVSAERAVTGYKDPYTGDKISLFQAMKNGLIVHDHGVRLLEAQIATGGIIDPVESHRLPVEVAYQRGYFDQEMNQILSDPTDDTKGFFDPNTHENLTYMQLLHRCTPDPDTGLLMLHVMDKGSSSFHLNENTRKSLQAEKTKVDVGLFQGQEVSLWDLLFSRYVSPHLRQDLLRQYKAGTVTIQSLTRVLTDLVTETEERNAAQTGPRADPSTPTSVQHQAARAEQERTLRSTTVSMPVGAQQGQQVPVWDLLFSNYVSAEKRTELLDLHQKGLLPLDQLKSVLSTLVTKKDATSRPLAVKVRWPGQETASAEPLGGAAALLADPTGEAGSDSTHPGKEEDPGHAEQEEMEEALKSRQVEVAVGTFRGQKVSVWDLLHSAYFPKEKQKELLQLYYSGILTLDQMVTVVTGIVTKTEEEKSKEASHAPQHPDRWEDALRSHTVVLHVGEFQGQEVPLWDLLFSQYIPDFQREELLTRYRSGALSLQDLIATAASFLPGAGGTQGREAEGVGRPVREESGAAPSLRDDELERALRQVTIAVPVGELQGSRRSVWELLFSKYVTAEARQELLEKYRARSVSAEDLVRTITGLITEMEEKSHRLKFSGLRRQVTASELFDSRIIDQDTLSELTQGSKTVEEVTERDTVKRYLEGTSCIAGVLVPSKSDPSRTEKMSIYQAMWKGVLRPGTALVLLEAQAATGFIVDPLKNVKLSVDEAVSAELVGAEIQEKLVSAERAVTGYKDPYTGDKISLFQAMKNGLIVHDHGVRLLEAQIATGGIIDPVESHRLPVEVAYQRGYFDQEMNQILSDPTDDTKGFFDPNTHENLTYMQLLHRCTPDPDTGLLMLHVMDKGSSSFHLNENTRKSLQAEKTKVDVGLFQGQEVSLWDLLFSRYVSPHLRQDLLRQYKAGTVTIQSLTRVLTDLVTETEERNAAQTGPRGDPSTPTSVQHQAAHADQERTLRSTTVSMPVGAQQGQQVPVWDLLFSNYVSAEKRTELLDLHQKGLLPLDQLKSVLSTLVTKKDATSRPLAVKVRWPGQETASAEPLGGAAALLADPTGEAGSDSTHPGKEEDPGHAEQEEMEEALKSRQVEVAVGTFRGQKVSVWDLLHSAYFPKEKQKELLQLYYSGILTLDQMVTVVTGIVTKTEEEKSKEASHAPQHPDRWEDALRSHTVVLHVGEFQGQEVPLWDLLFSHYFSDCKREELLCLYRNCNLTPEELSAIISTLISESIDGSNNQTPGFTLSADVTSPRRQEDPGIAAQEEKEEALKSRWVEVPGCKFLGQKVSVWELLHSSYFPEEKQKELLQLYDSGILTLDQMETVVTTVVNRMEGVTPHGPEASAVGEETGPARSSHYDLLQHVLHQANIDVTIRDFQLQKSSVWDPFFSRVVSDIRRDEMVHHSGAPAVVVKERYKSSTTVLACSEVRSSVPCTTGESHEEDTLFPEQFSVSHKDEQEDTARVVKSSVLKVSSGEFYEQDVSLRNPLHTQHIPEEKKKELLELYGSGILTAEGCRAHSQSGHWEGLASAESAEPVLPEDEGAGHHRWDRMKKALKSRVVEVAAGEFQGQKVSAWDLLHSAYFPEEKRMELLQLYYSGILTLDQMETVITSIVNKTEEERAGDQACAGSEGRVKGLSAENQNILRSETFVVPVGALQGQPVSCWDLLFSDHIPEEKRQELVCKLEAKALSVQELAGALTDIITEREEGQRAPSAKPASSSREEGLQGVCQPPATDQQQLKKSLRTTMVHVKAGEFRGQKVCVLDLLFSKYVPQDKRQELLELYRAETLPIQEMIGKITAMIEEVESKCGKAHPRRKMSCKMGGGCWMEQKKQS